LSVPPFSYRSAQLFISVNPVRSHLERIREQTLLRRRSELTPLEKARQSGVEREVLGP
jgi:DNA-binding CsgD family transcriptional regulator